MKPAAPLAVSLLALPLLACGATVDGDWNLHLERFGESFGAARVSLQSHGKKLTGTLNELKLEGTFDNGALELKGIRPDGAEWGKLQGRLQGDDIVGTGVQHEEEFAWKAHRAAAAPAAPRTHDFTPKVFYRAFAGTIEPALRINSGDTVRTTTVDAGGYDAAGKRRQLGGNPLTGPFYVEGAMPGDTLAIHFTRIRLNRDSAESGTRIVPSALSRDYYRDAKFDKDASGSWKLDREAGMASLAKAGGRLKNIKLPVEPMLGCVGVAPPQNQSFRSGWLGGWGGNMDYKGLREGVTVYLPVNQEGALLFVGDGHALEGDGELAGDALETSMDVEFNVRLIRGQRTGGPRFESDEYLMASGIAGSLAEAFSDATSELARWLERDYKLSAGESNTLLGAAVKYDIAEVVDPQVHVVAKIGKSVLAMIEK